MPPDSCFDESLQRDTSVLFKSRPRGKRMLQAKVLADRLYCGEGIAADAVRIAAANVLLALCAHIVIPLPFTPVPITGQTFGVLLIAAMLGARRSAIALVFYLLEGLAGLPVFQPLGVPGPARFMGPTAGYLVAYPLAAFVTGWLVERAAAATLPRAFRWQPAGAVLAGALFCGEAIIFLGGWAWLAFGMRLGWPAAFRAGVIPFVPGEIIKMALIVALLGSFAMFRREV
jgi:biotin transport system substrate-specific component